MTEKIEKEFEKFVKENPYADSLEIAKHFFLFGVKYEMDVQAKAKEMAKEFEKNSPPYYGG